MLALCLVRTNVELWVSAAEFIDLTICSAHSQKSTVSRMASWSVNKYSKFHVCFACNLFFKKRAQWLDQLAQLLSP